MFRRRVDVSIRIRNFCQFDTTNVLFICGGAFDGLEKIIQRRMGEKVIGFNSEIMLEKPEEAKNPFASETGGSA